MRELTHLEVTQIAGATDSVVIVGAPYTRENFKSELLALSIPVGFIMGGFVTGVVAQAQRDMNGAGVFVFGLLGAVAGMFIAPLTTKFVLKVTFAVYDLVA